MTPPRPALSLAARPLAAASLLAVLLAAPACVQEDWGGPKGPPLNGPETPPSTAYFAPDSGAAGQAAPRPAETTSETSAQVPAAPGDAPAFSAAGAGDGGGSGGLTPRVEATLSGGKIPGFDDAVAGMRSTLKACVDGKASANARVEITARIGPKGNVLKSDKVGGSSFSQGAVPCLIRRIEAAQFKKPTEGSPRITFRVRMTTD